MYVLLLGSREYILGFFQGHITTHLYNLVTMLLFIRYKANVFSSKRERTYEMLLQDMYDNYWSHGTDWDSGRANSAGSIKLYGHQRKLQEQMVRK